MTTRSFVVRVWLEEWIGDDGESQWRGHIIHVPSTKYQYFDDLQNIVIFIRDVLDLTPVTPQ